MLGVISGSKEMKMGLIRDINGYENLFSGDPLMEPRIYSQVLLVSNGHAEDLAAAAIGTALQKLQPDTKLSALPLVGLGKAYDKAGITNLGLKKNLPSGGFAKEGWRHFLYDLRSGFFGLLFKQISVLRQAAKDVDLIVAVGDAYLVALCGFFTRKPLIFIDGPKSVKIAGYWPLELWLMKKFCQKIIVQDKETADYLQSQGLPAVYLGSWVMDYVPVTGDDFGIAQDKTVIGILPGTREEAYANLVLVLDLLTELKGDNYVGLIASTLDREKLRAKGILERIENFSFPIKIIEGKFGDVCLRSKLIIGLAGIANEQAVAFGRPVVCFPGTGAQTTLRRWQEIHKITGDSMLIIEGTAKEKAAKVFELLNNPTRLAEMGKIGKASKPLWGGIEKIANLIKKHTGASEDA